jgi:hypothetical protein
VEVAAEWQGDHYEAGAIARQSDRMIALYPHCSRGTTKHIKNAVKWWFVGVTAWLVVAALFFFFMIGREDYVPFMAYGFHYGALASYAFFGLMAFSLTRKWMPFVRLTERVCRTLGIPDSGNVDLVKSAKAQRKPDDPGEYGSFYFRY